LLAWIIDHRYAGQVQLVGLSIHSISFLFHSWLVVEMDDQLIFCKCPSPVLSPLSFFLWCSSPKAVLYENHIVQFYLYFDILYSINAEKVALFQWDGLGSHGCKQECWSTNGCCLNLVGKQEKTMIQRGCMGFMFVFQTTFADSYSLVWQEERWRLESLNASY